MNWITSLVHFIGADYIATAAIIPALAATVANLYWGVLAVRAKRRASYAMRSAMLHDIELRKLLAAYDRRKAQEAEINIMLEKIHQNIKRLSKQDQSFVELGLRQSSRQGLKRYIGDVIGNPSIFHADDTAHVS